MRVDPLFSAPPPARAYGTSLTSEPGARTAWHTHALAQALIVTAGWGRVQRWGGPIQEIGPGDTVWLEPGEKHWYGVAPTTAMPHVAIAERPEAQGVKWLGEVSDEDYLTGLESQ